LSSGAIVQLVEDTYTRLADNFCVEAVQKIATVLDPDRGEDRQGLRQLILMLSALKLGTEVGVLREFTGYDHSSVARIKNNLESAGLWRGNETFHCWEDWPDIIDDQIAADMGRTVEDWVAEARRDMRS
jgi:hypothetical protein